MFAVSFATSAIGFWADLNRRHHHVMFAQVFIRAPPIHERLYKTSLKLPTSPTSPTFESALKLGSLVWQHQNDEMAVSVRLVLISNEYLQVALGVFRKVLNEGFSIVYERS